MLPSVTQPPPAQGGDGELGRVGRGAHGDKPLVAEQIVEAVRNRDPFGQRGIVVEVDGQRLPTQRSARVFEPADEFAFLGIHADHRPALPQKLALLLTQVAELAARYAAVLRGVPLRTGLGAGFAQVFAVDLGRIIQVPEQSAHGGRADRMQRLQLLGQGA